MKRQSLKLCFPCFFFVLLLGINCSSALDIGIRSADSLLSLDQTACSRKCESAFCSVPPFLRYGKYCGILYSGCPGEIPCDGLDSCCMNHDACVQRKDGGYLSKKCSQNLIDCLSDYKKSGSNTFVGNQCDAERVIDVITAVMEAAIFAGRFLPNP